MNQYHLSNSLSERIRSFQQQPTAITLDQQEQLNAFMGGLLDNDSKAFGGAQQAEETFDDRNHQDNHVDIAPLPLNASHFTGHINADIDRQALDELYKTLSNGDHHLDATNGMTFTMSNANVNFGSSIRPLTGMYSAPNPSFSFTAQFQNQLGCYPQQCNNNMNQQNQGAIAFPSFSQDGASASQLSSEALMNSLFSANLNVLNHIQMKNTTRAPMPLLVNHPVEIEAVTKKPVKALSAYNFFFRDQRDRILHGAEEDYSAEKQEELLSGQ
jgi:hypothetical protein